MVPPRWAHDPLSGEGARRHGGRFNAPGAPAFYSALDPHTAYAEYTQGLFDRPGLLCAFMIEDAKLLDLRVPAAREALDISLGLLTGRWAGLPDPPTQALGLRIAAEGYDGAVYFSLQHAAGGNVVLWRWNESGRPRITLLDRLGEAIDEPIRRDR